MAGFRRSALRVLSPAPPGDGFWLPSRSLTRSDQASPLAAARMSTHARGLAEAPQELEAPEGAQHGESVDPPVEAARPSFSPAQSLVRQVPLAARWRNRMRRCR